MIRRAIFVLLLFIQSIAGAQPFFYNHSFFFRTPGLPDSLEHYSIRPVLFTDSNLIHSDSVPSGSFLKRKLFSEHLINLRGEDYHLSFDFLPDLLVGYEYRKNTAWLNTRGFELQGHVGKKVAFSSSFFENQAEMPSWVDTFITRRKVVPGQGITKVYGKNKVWDFAYATAYISYSPDKHFNFQLGHGKNFLGDGYRSVILSDIGSSYPFFKITTDIWKFRYQVLYTQFTDIQAPLLSFYAGYRKKYGTFHYLDWQVAPRLNLGLFEAIVWQDADTAGRRGFEWSYLNPIIFLRPVEFSLGSPDNALMGINAKWQVFSRTHFYGQFLLDEFKAKEIRAGNGWWANKFGAQAGVNVQELFGFKGMNAFTEFNLAKPFTYSHQNVLLNYAHENQSLAHPLGANFYESVSALRYVADRWVLSLQFNYALYGKDTAGANFGSDLFKSYASRSKEYGNYIAQGNKAVLYYTDFRLGYLLNPLINLRIEAGMIMRTEQVAGKDQVSELFTIGLRSSFRNIYYDF